MKSGWLHLKQFLKNFESRKKISKKEEARSFVRMNQAFCVCLTTPTQSTFFGFFLLVFRHAGPPQRWQEARQ